MDEEEVTEGVVHLVKVDDHVEVAHAGTHV